MLLLCYFFFQKKDNQKKVKVFRVRGGSAYRADNTATHPLIYYMYTIFANLLFRTDRFFHPAFDFPTNIHPGRYIFRLHDVGIFFSDFREFIKRGDCGVYFLFIEPYFTPPSPNSPQKIIYFFRMLLLFFVRLEGRHIINPSVKFCGHFSYSAGLR